MTEEENPPPVPAGPKTSAMAIWSLVLGISSVALCLGFLTGIPAVIMGIVSGSRIRNSGGRLGGNGLAIGGIVTGGAGLVFGTAMLAAIALPVVVSAKHRAKLAMSESNAKQIVVGVRAYAEDHDGDLPKTLEELVPDYLVDRAVLTSPFAEEADEISYKLLVKGNLEDYPEPSRTVILHDANKLPDGRILTAFLDGRVALGQVAGTVAPPPGSTPPVRN